MEAASGIGGRGIAVGAPVARVVPACDAGELEAVGGLFAEVHDGFVGDLVAREAEQELRVTVVPAAVIADHPDRRVGALGRGHGHADGDGGGVEFFEVGADRGADVEIHVCRFARGNPQAAVFHGQRKDVVEAFIGLFRRGAVHTREEHQFRTVVVRGFDRVVDLGADAEVGGVPGEGLRRAHVVGRNDDLPGQRMQHGRHDLVGVVGLYLVELLAGGEESRRSRQHHRISCNFHSRTIFRVGYLSVAFP